MMFRNRPAALFGGLTIACLLVPSPADAQACSKWQFPATFRIEQTNGITTTFHLEQKGTQLTGGAMFPKHEPRNITLRGTTYRISGTADGTLSGNAFNVTVYWGRGEAIGVYTGSINPQGRLSGSTYDQRRPSSKATWFGTALLQCQPQAASAPAPAAKPVKRLGKRPTTNPIVK